MLLRTCVSRVSLVLHRCLSSDVSAMTSTGIEHADAMKAVGEKHKKSVSDYKVPEYHNGNIWTYYDVEVSMTKQRLPQPTPRQPDVERKSKAPPPEKAK